jgi:hypothetical protein
MDIPEIARVAYEVDRAIVASSGQRCEQCWDSLPELTRDLFVERVRFLMSHPLSSLPRYLEFKAPHDDSGPGSAAVFRTRGAVFRVLILALKAHLLPPRPFTLG